jgi:hypothetical protein
MTKMRLRLSWPTSSHRFDHYSVLTIVDDESGQQLLEVEMSADQFASLHANRGAVAEVDLITADRFYRIGKSYVHERVDFPEEFKRYNPPYSDGRRRASDEMRDWAAAFIDGTDWESFTWSLHNTGWALTVYKYATPETGEQD